MYRNRLLSMMAIVAVFVLVAGPALAQSPDLTSNITGSVDTAAPGSTVTYQVEVSNVGDADTSNEIILDVYLPSGVPCDINAYLNGDADALAAFDAMGATFAASDNIWINESAPGAGDGSGIFFGVDSYCENFLLQPQKLRVASGDAPGAFLFDAVMPTPPLTEGVVHVTSASMDQDLTYGRGGCDSATTSDCTAGPCCQDHPCLGPRVSTIEPITGTVELVSGPGGGLGTTPDMGCGSLQGFTAGNIALINRGKCAFEVKIANALFAGASAVIIADSDDFSDSTTNPTDVLNMACTDFCSEALVTIPAVFISYADGQTIGADLGAGAVTATIGKKDVGNQLTTKANIWENATTSDDANSDNNRSSVTTTVGTAGNAPVAAFTYEATGLDVVFTDASTESPTSWAWDFGDGSTSTDQNPSHSYGAAGTYTVSLTATNDAGSDTHSEDITVSAGGGACTPIWIAAAGSAAGAGGSQWATDLGIVNLGADALNYQFQFLPRNTDNSAVGLGETMTLAGNSSIGYADIWQSMTGNQEFGSINVCVDHPDMAGVIARVYNSSDAGTFGQTIVGMQGSAAKMISTGTKVRLGFLSQNADYRTNVGFMNAGAAAITINAEFFTADGTSLGTDSIAIPAYSSNQWNKAFTRVTTDPVNFGYVDVWSDSDGASFLTYGSVVDNATGDPTTIWPFEPSMAKDGAACTPIWIAAAGSAAGAGGSQWATDLGLTNLGADALTYYFQFLPRNMDNSAVTMSDAFTLAGNAAVGYTDIWQAMTGGQDFGSINVCVDNAMAAGVIARVYNSSDTGTFGQTINGMMGSAAKLVGPAETARLGFLSQNSAFRTNIGFMNAGAAAITINVAFYGADGTALGTDSIEIPAYSSNQWNKAFTRVTSDDVNFGYADVSSSTDGASFLTYGSVVDNATGDPTTIWPF